MTWLVMAENVRSKAFQTLDFESVNTRFASVSVVKTNKIYTSIVSKYLRMTAEGSNITWAFPDLNDER